MKMIDLKELARALAGRDASLNLKAMAAESLARPVPAIQRVDDARDRMVRNVAAFGRKDLTPDASM